MIIMNQSTLSQLQDDTAVTIGKFDGIHKGHQKLIEKIIEQKKSGLKAVVFTFDPPPSVLFGKHDNKELTSKIEKRMIFEKIGIDILVEYPLNKETAGISPKEFVEELLVKRLRMKMIVAGSDVSFGHRGAGNLQFLLDMASKLNFCVEIVPKVCYEKKEISSSMIREYVSKGKMDIVETLLDSPYTIKGIVQYGNQLGRTFGMPTVNLIPQKEKLLPPLGVYFSKVIVGDICYCGVTNIGCKPTVSKEKITGVETYLYGYDGNLYGTEIEIQLLQFERSEKQFEKLEDLINQLQIDMENGKKYHKLV